MARNLDCVQRRLPGHGSGQLTQASSGPVRSWDNRVLSENSDNYTSVTVSDVTEIVTIIIQHCDL